MLDEYFYLRQRDIQIFYKHVKVKCSNNITNRTNQCVQECLDDKRLFAIVFTLPVIFMHMNDEKPFMKGLTEGRLIFFFFLFYIQAIEISPFSLVLFAKSGPRKKPIRRYSFFQLYAMV